MWDMASGTKFHGKAIGDSITALAAFLNAVAESDPSNGHVPRTFYGCKGFHCTPAAARRVAVRFCK